MIKTCVVCGKTFNATTWNKIMCSEECVAQRKYECWLAHKARKEQEEQAKKKKESKPPKTGPTKSKITLVKGDPRWVKDYEKGDRLTQISMLARALTDYGIVKISYGVLSTYWDTSKYYNWESIVISRKRKEKANGKQYVKDIQAAEKKGTFKGKKWPYSIKLPEG